MRLDLGLAIDRERPRRGLEAQIEPRQPNKRDVHAAWSQARLARSSLDSPLHHDHRAAADRSPRQLAAADLERQFHQARAAHLVALFDAYKMRAILVTGVSGEVPGERRRG